MDSKIKETVEQANSIALATVGEKGVNVVPISVVSVAEEEIHLYDFFMNKTVENIKTNPEVALLCWTGFTGIQVKAQVIYEESGRVFDAAVTVMKERFPDRILKAVLRLKPSAIYDVAPGSLGQKIL